MKKIVILALHLNYGGIERYISLLCKALSQEYQIEIISSYKYSDTPAYYFDESVKIKYLSDDYPDKVSIKKMIKKFQIIKIIKELIRRKKLDRLILRKNIEEIKNLDSDYVITTRIYHHQLVSKYLKNSKVKKIATEHNYHNNNEQYINDLIGISNYFDYVVVCTDELYDFYKSKISNLVKIYNAIELSDKRVNLNNMNLISVGRLSLEKGYFDLIEVMKFVHELDAMIRLTICGDGYQRNQIEEKIEEYHLSDCIHITGFLNDEALEKEYLNSSLYILPSISEAFGLVLLEAMNYGLPCIAFDRASGARHLLGNDVGILISNSDNELMARKIVELLHETKKLKEYQKKSLECVQKYSLKNMYMEWKKIL